MLLKNIAIGAAICFGALSGCGGGNGPAEPMRVEAPILPILSKSHVMIGPNSIGAQSWWPDRSTSTGGQGKPIAGVNCLVNEDYHVHAHLTIIRHGVTLRIPKDIGLSGCAYELHTHDSSGVIHIETDTVKQFTLGQFFSVWGQTLTAVDVAGIQASEIAVFGVQDGIVTRFNAAPSDIKLTKNASIIIVIGQLPVELPSYQWPLTI